MHKYKVTLLATLVAAFTTSIAAQNILLNPDFEIGSYGDNPPDGIWTFLDHSGLTNGPHIGKSAYINAPIHDVFGSVSQTFNTISGQTYAISFWLSNNGSFAGGDIAVTFGGSTIFSQSYSGTFLHDTLFSFTNPATGPSTTLTFSGQHLDGTFFIDDVSVLAIPEPSMYALWGGIGTLGFYLVSRRKA